MDYRGELTAEKIYAHIGFTFNQIFIHKMEDFYKLAISVTIEDDSVCI